MNGMIRKIGVWSLVLALAICSGASGVAAQAIQCEAKVDNFVFFADQSGSMYLYQKELKELNKFILAKKLMMSMNDLIPALNFQSSLALFAPFQTVLAPTPYDKAAMGAAVQALPDEQPTFGRLTPMGPGIDQLGSVLSGMSGSTAVILLSDGAHNLGESPVAMAQRIYSQYPNVCFHVVSFADTPEGKAINQQIAQMGNGCLYVEANDLLENAAALEAFIREIFCREVAEIVREEVIVLRGIHFDFDKYNIKSEWVPVLDEAISILQANPNMSVIVEGHTDAIGTVEYNQRLSERRARSVYNYLLDHGVSANRMQTVGYSELRPIATNETAEGRAMNRRVEFNVEPQ